MRRSRNVDPDDRPRDADHEAWAKTGRYRLAAPSADASNKEADVSDTGQSQPRWFKSSRSGPGDCVDVAFVADAVWVRDSKDPDGPVLKFSAESWTAFLADLPDRARGAAAG
jgi:hypothetical protein